MRLGSISFGDHINGFSIRVVQVTEKPDGYTCDHKEYVTFKINHNFSSQEYRLTEDEAKQLIKMLEKSIDAIL